jgi:hypothetical protein
MSHRRGVLGVHRRGGARPVHPVCPWSAPGAAARADRRRPLPPGQARQRHRHQGAAAGHSGPARPPRTQGRPDLGEPAAVAARPERLSARGFARMWNGAMEQDPSGELLAAWIAREELRALLGCAAQGGNRHDIAHRLTRFYGWCGRRAGGHHPGRDRRDLVADDPRIPADRHHQRRHRRHQPAHQGSETPRLRFRNRRHFRDRVRLHCIRSRGRTPARQARLPAQN